MLIVSRTRVQIEAGQIMFRTHDPLWYHHYDPWVIARGVVLWVKYDAGIVCVEWSYINGNPPTSETRYQCLGSYDLDRSDTHYAVSMTSHSEHLWPVWLTEKGLDEWSNIMFRHMR